MSADSKTSEKRAQLRTDSGRAATVKGPLSGAHAILTSAETDVAMGLKRVLGERGLDESLESVLAAVSRTVSALPSTQATPVDQETINYLVAHSGVPGAERLRAWDPVTADERRVKAAAATTTELETSMLSRDEVAGMLEVDRSRVSHMAKEGRVYAVNRVGRPRYPRWQFYSGQPLPGLRGVVDTIRAVDLHPLDLAAFMESPTPALGGRSPVEHLRSEGDPTAVATLLDAVVRQ